MLLSINHSTTSWILLIGLFIATVPSISISEELEATQLAHVTTEIDFLIKRIDEINDASKRLPSQRITFRYQDLINDLEIVKRGISDYIKADLRDGTVIRPLDGRYR